MGKWARWVKAESRHPCDGCQVGFSSQSHKVVDNKHWFKSDFCQETCERYKEYCNRKVGSCQPAYTTGR